MDNMPDELVRQQLEYVPRVVTNDLQVTSRRMERVVSSVIKYNLRVIECWDSFNVQLSRLGPVPNVYTTECSVTSTVELLQSYREKCFVNVKFETCAGVSTEGQTRVLCELFKLNSYRIVFSNSAEELFDGRVTLLLDSSIIRLTSIEVRLRSTTSMTANDLINIAEIMHESRYTKQFDLRVLEEESRLFRSNWNANEWSQFDGRNFAWNSSILAIFIERKMNYDLISFKRKFEMPTIQTVVGQRGADSSERRNDDNGEHGAGRRAASTRGRNNAAAPSLAANIQNSTGSREQNSSAGPAVHANEWADLISALGKLPKMDDHLRLVLCLLAGELQLMTPPACSIFVYVGDLYRYQQSPFSLRLSRLYYTRAMMEDPDAAKPLNQLSIMMDHLPAVRCLLQDAACSKKFRVTERNLEDRLMTSAPSASLVRVAKIIEAVMKEKGTEEELFTTASKEWTEALKEFVKGMRRGEKKVKSPSPPPTSPQQVQPDEILLQLHCISLTAAVAHPRNASSLIDLIQSSLLFLLEKKKEEEEEEVVKIGRRRRRASESNEEVRGRRRRDSDEDDDNDLPGEKNTDQSKESSAATAASPFLLGSLSIALEWIQRVDEGRTAGDGRYAPTKVMREKMKLDQLVNLTLLRLNEVKGVEERVESLLDVNLSKKTLVQWRIMEKLGGKEREDEEGVKQWIALWTAKILTQEEESIQQSPSGFIPRNGHSIMRKMAALHLNAQSTKSFTTMVAFENLPEMTEAEVSAHSD